MMGKESPIGSGKWKIPHDPNMVAGIRLMFIAERAKRWPSQRSDLVFDVCCRCLTIQEELKSIMTRHTTPSTPAPKALNKVVLRHRGSAHYMVHESLITQSDSIPVHKHEKRRTTRCKRKERKLTGSNSLEEWSRSTVKL